MEVLISRIKIRARLYALKKATNRTKRYAVMDAILLKQSAEKHLPSALDLLRRMVAINSFTTNTDGVAALAGLTADCFKELGFTATLAASTHDQHGDHLFLSCGPADQRPLVLVTHLDTVFPPEEEQRNNFGWLEEGDRIYGPGTVDNKGGTVMIWLMMQVLREVNPVLFESTHWLIAANSAEEVIGSDFAERTRERCPDGARAVLVFEGGPVDEEGWHIVTSRKGRAEYRITCTGRAAHAGSNHALGINAVVELSKLLPKVAALTDTAQNLTVNVANIHGGTVLNRVPHEAVAELEMRAFDPAVLARAGEVLEALAGETEAGAQISIQCVGRTRAWPGGAATDQLFLLWQKHAAAMGLHAVPMKRGGLSDANYLCELGPTLDAMGPMGGNAHCSERSADGSKLPEYVQPSSYAPKAVMNLLAITEIL
jgi:glutamate carboxypeptidase